MKIISWNVNGIRAVHKKGLFMPFIGKYQPDILCLQETKARPEQLPEEVRNIPGYFSYFSHPEIKKGYSGVAIYSKEKPKEIFYGMDIKKLDDEGRLIGVKYKNFTLINVYFPNAGRELKRLKYKLDFYAAFLKFVLKLRKNGEYVIFCGDINTAHKEIDLARPKDNVENTGFLPIERAWIDKVIKNDFVDIYRKFYPNKTGAYTYWDQKMRCRDRNIGWRIDYFFPSSELFSKIKKAEIMSDYYGSDHCPILIEI